MSRMDYDPKTDVTTIGPTQPIVCGPYSPECELGSKVEDLEEQVSFLQSEVESLESENGKLETTVEDLEDQVATLKEQLPGSDQVSRSEEMLDELLDRLEHKRKADDRVLYLVGELRADRRRAWGARYGLALQKAREESEARNKTS